MPSGSGLSQAPPSTWKLQPSQLRGRRFTATPSTERGDARWSVVAAWQASGGDRVTVPSPSLPPAQEQGKIGSQQIVGC